MLFTSLPKKIWLEIIDWFNKNLRFLLCLFVWLSVLNFRVTSSLKTLLWNLNSLLPLNVLVWCSLLHTQLLHRDRQSCEHSISFQFQSFGFARYLILLLIRIHEDKLTDTWFFEKRLIWGLGGVHYSYEFMLIFELSNCVNDCCRRLVSTSELARPCSASKSGQQSRWYIILPGMSYCV